MQLTSDTTPLMAKIGVSVTELAMLPALNGGQKKRIKQLAKKVGENIFNFMQSFCSEEGDRLVVPMDILNWWFSMFQEGVKRDPEYFEAGSWSLDCIPNRPKERIKHQTPIINILCRYLLSQLIAELGIC
ncbi:hypothetical protein EJ110_NYTH10483 [Nymphaea thermarum]|nr:hypothetical protein EJ110_NYTH10483 [Nymphaea thermarum]